MGRPNLNASSVSEARLEQARQIARRMIAQRKKRGLTQFELADSSGVSRDVIAKIETGQVYQPRGLAQLAEALEVTVSWLQFGEAPLTPAERQFLERLRALEPKDRRAVQQLVSSLAARPEE